MATPTKIQTEEAQESISGWSDNPAGRDAHIVILKSGDGFYGIDIKLVQEITEVPGSASHIAGMTDLRGRVIPVAEFSRLLSHEPTERDDDTRILVVEHDNSHIGLVVDAVTEVMLVDGSKIEDAGSAGAQDHDFIVGVAALEDHFAGQRELRAIEETLAELETERGA